MLRCCEDCKAKCNDDFKKIVELNRSGLVIYVYKKKHEDSVQKNLSVVRGNETVVLHNPTDKELKRPNYINELCQYKTNCLQCRMLIQKVRNLLNEIKDIRKSETVAVCDFCKQSSTNRCKRCEYIVHKFMNDKIKQYQDRQESFKVWLCRVQLFLQSLLEQGAICHHPSNSDGSLAKELEELLKELKPPLTMRQPDINIFPIVQKLTSLENLSENKKLIEEILNLIKSEQNPASPTTCVCKTFMDEKSGNIFSEELKTKRIDDPDGKIVREGQVLKIKPENVKNSHDEQKKEPSKATATKKAKATEKKAKKSLSAENKENNDMKKSPSRKSTKTKQSPSDAVIMGMIKEERLLKMREKEEKLANKNAIIIPTIADLPVPVRLEEPKSDASGSIIECSVAIDASKEMIKGEKIVKYHQNYPGGHIGPVKPVFHKVCAESATDLSFITGAPNTTINTASLRNSNKLKKSKSTQNQENMEDHAKGVIKYQLSNREFIEKGWTQLPTTKIMRRMNIYKMVPADPKCNWFTRNITNKIQYYATGEKFAEIDDTGCGKWYYKNGRMALDYYSAQEANIDHRYIIYSDGESDFEKHSAITILGAFDTLGNGVVYDLCGKERLKYNQSEGMLIDEKLGPPGRWKWHTLNDPPVLQPVFIDSNVKYKDPCIELLQQQNKQESSSKDAKQPEIDMLAIELENFLKEKEHKLLQKFQSFKIKAKILKLNRQFSLRIFDQANIYIGFNEDRISLRLNIGMLLINNEIVDTETGEVSTLVTPYDRLIPKSESVTQIQRLIRNAGIRKQSKSYDRLKKRN